MDLGEIRSKQNFISKYHFMKIETAFISTFVEGIKMLFPKIKEVEKTTSQAAIF